MKLAFSPPDTRQDSWGSIPVKIRDTIRMWISAFEELPVVKPIEHYFEQVATYTGSSPGTAKRHYYALKNSRDWKVLIPKNHLGKVQPDVRTNNKEFRNYLVKLAGKYQRGNAPAIRKLHRQWKAGHDIPGYEDKKGWPALPEGWSEKNLNRIINEETSKEAQRSIHIGVSSKTNPGLPQVITTRTNLWPGAIYQLDDVWHDNFVTVGKDRKACRVLELGVLDLFSAARIHHGCKPRIKNEEGKYENLKEKETLFLLAGLFHGIGYSPRGTMLMAEHGAAAVTERAERILYDATGGMIRLDRQPIEGTQQALANFWGGSEGGNYRAKAALESSHNLIHNDLSALELQTGKDPAHRPVVTNRMLSYIASIMKQVIKHAPENRERVLLPGMDFHSQFVPFVRDYYRFGLNARTDHNLEGWKKLGFFITEYTAVPGSDQWLTPEQFLALPESSQQILAANAYAEPNLWSNKRNLSPWEIWEPAMSNMLRIPDHTVAELLGPSFAREEVVKRKFFHWHDQTTEAEELIYESRILTPEGTYRELPNGEKYSVFSNPFEDRWLFVTDARGIYLGKAELVKRVSSINPEVFFENKPFEERSDIRSPELKKAAGKKHERIADIHEPDRIRHADEVQATKAGKEYNKRLVKGEETDATKRKQKAARKAAKTRQDKADKEATEDTFAVFADEYEDAVVESIEF